MKTAVCFKTIVDVGALSDQNWRVEDGWPVCVRYRRQMFNCFDESALEIALRLAGQSKDLDKSVTLTALTIDDQKADPFLKHLLALEYHKAVRIRLGQQLDLRFDPLSVSHLIGTYVERIGGQQLLLVGSQGGEGDNHQTGPLIAERLGWPHIRDVTDVTLSDEPDCLKVRSRLDGAGLEQTAALPLVLSIGNAPNASYLRIPTLKQKFREKKRQVEILSCADLGLDEEKLFHNDKTLISLTQRVKKRDCIFIEGRDAREKAGRLYDRYLRERLMR